MFTGCQWCLESLLKGKSKPSECAKPQTDQCVRVVVKLRVAHGQGDTVGICAELLSWLVGGRSPAHRLYCNSDAGTCLIYWMSNLHRDWQITSLSKFLSIYSIEEGSLYFYMSAPDR